MPCTASWIGMDASSTSIQTSLAFAHSLSTAATPPLVASLSATISISLSMSAFTCG